MPGVVVNTGVRVGGTGVEVAPSSTFFVVGTAERGRTATPFVVRSMFVFRHGRLCWLVGMRLCTGACASWSVRATWWCVYFLCLACFCVFGASKSLCVTIA